MRVSFRQGIVRYHHPNFLNVNGSTVDLLATDTPLVITIAHGAKNFLHTEYSDITAAWHGVVPTIDQWLYIDINQRTGVRTFGITTTLPLVGPTAPLVPLVNQHWFDTTNNLMKVWNGQLWHIKVRILLCNLEDGTVPISISDNMSGFDGTQINDHTDNNSGLILFDGLTGYPIKDDQGRFVTTEDTLFSSSSTDTQLKVESVILQAIAATNIPKYSIVKFYDYGIVNPANAYTAGSTEVFGIIMRDVVQNNIIDITLRGVVSSDDWDWSAHPVNTQLYINNSGILQPTKVFPEQVPVATIIDYQSIMVGVPQVTLTTISNPPMTTALLGIAKISVAPVSPAEPIVVGDNDGRMTDARTPLAHTHPISEVTSLQTNLDSKLNLTGGTLTGALVLHANPTSNLGAATKQYVDNVILTDLADVVITAAANNDMIKFNGTNWVNTPIPPSTIILQGDASGSGTTANPVDVTLATVTTSGTSTKVTYDDKGRITSGTTLVASDIPDLDWAKITTGTPTTIAGYGITDAYTKTETEALNWAWSDITSGVPTTISGYGITDAYTKTETEALNWAWSDITSGVPTTLSGYGITDAITNALGTPSIYQDIFANRPAGTTGQLFIDATNNKVQRYDGAAWVDLSVLTPTQHTWINNITASAAEVNYLVGVNSSVQTQLNDRQPLDADLTAIAALTGTSGFLKTNGSGTWSVDTIVPAPINNPSFTGVVSAPELLINTDTNLTTVTLVTATLSATTLDSFLTTLYRSAEYLVQITTGTDYQISKILLIHDGTTLFMTEYSTIRTGPVLGTFGGTISTGSVLFEITPAFVTSTTIKAVRTGIKV